MEEERDWNDFMDFKERLDKSNEESIIIEREEVSITRHLMINKVLIPTQKNKNKMLAFFKMYKGRLQLHVRINNEWKSFNVLDATEEEKERNKRFNYE